METSESTLMLEKLVKLRELTIGGILDSSHEIRRNIGDMESKHWSKLVLNGIIENQGNNRKPFWRWVANAEPDIYMAIETLNDQANYLSLKKKQYNKRDDPLIDTKTTAAPKVVIPFIKKVLATYMSSTSFTNKNHQEDSVSIILNIDYLTKTFSIEPENGRFDFSGNDLKHLKAELESINNAIDIATKELGL